MNLADAIEKLNLPRLVELFHHHQVEHIVIGGTAAILLGSPQLTFDIDLCYRRDAANLDRLAAALKTIHPTLRGAPPDLPFQLDARSLALGSNFTFNTDFGPLDLLGYVEPLGGYEELLPGSELISLGEIAVRLIGLNDLITVKRHIRRPKDQVALLQLEAIQRLRDESPK